MQNGINSRDFILDERNKCLVIKLEAAMAVITNVNAKIISVEQLKKSLIDEKIKGGNT